MRTNASKIGQARLLALKHFPYFSSILYHIEMREIKGIETLAITKDWVIYYDPPPEWSVIEIAGVLLHEIFHCIVQHSRRCNEAAADPRLFNICGDMEINSMLKNHDVVLPKGQFPEMYDMPENLLAEEYYKLFLERAKEGTGEPGPNDLVICCGSGSGHAHESEKNHVSGGKSPIEQKALLRSLAQAAQDHAKTAGSLPSSIQILVDTELSPPVISWQDQLRMAGGNAVESVRGNTTPTYTRRSRRQGYFGDGDGSPVLQAYDQDLPRIILAVDTSGSMGDQEFQEGLSEIKGILDSFPGAIVEVLCCDADVTYCGTVSVISEVVPKLVGGGGTSFVPVFEWIEKHPDHHPSVVVYVTDGYGSAPAKEPEYPCIFVLVGHDAGKPSSVAGDPLPWGTHIYTHQQDKNENTL